MSLVQCATNILTVRHSDCVTFLIMERSDSRRSTVRCKDEWWFFSLTVLVPIKSHLSMTPILNRVGPIQVTSSVAFWIDSLHWCWLDLFAEGDDFSRETIDRNRNLFYQRTLANDISTTMTESISLLTSALQIHLNVGQNFVVNTSQVMMSLETISVDSLRNSKSIDKSLIQLPSNLRSDSINNHSIVSLRVNLLSLFSQSNERSFFLFSWCSNLCLPSVVRKCRRIRTLLDLFRCRFSIRTVDRSRWTPMEIKQSSFAFLVIPVSSSHRWHERMSRPSSSIRLLFFFLINYSSICIMSISPLHHHHHFLFLFIFEWDRWMRVSPISSFTSSINHHNWTVPFSWSMDGLSSVLLNKVKTFISLSKTKNRSLSRCDKRKCDLRVFLRQWPNIRSSVVDLRSARTEWHWTSSLLPQPFFEHCSRPTTDDLWRRISFHCWLWTSSFHLGLLLSRRQSTMESRWTSGSTIVTVCWMRVDVVSIFV